VSKAPYFYYHTTVTLVPFGEPGVSIRNPTAKEIEDFKNEFDRGTKGSAVSLLISDNGDCGDGLLFEIATESTNPKDGPIVWANMTLAGAAALHETLGSILKMRSIEAKNKGGDDGQ
jgi:hypothetical protein